jgi:chloride channel protein, CIC family
MPDPDRSATTQDLVSRRGYLWLLTVCAAIGIPVSLAGFGFLALLHALEHLVWVDLPQQLGFAEPPWWWPLPCLLLAGLLVAAAIRWLPGHGGHPPAGGISAGPVPPAYLPGVLLAALAGLSLGAVLGPEAPLLALGTGLAVLLARPTGIATNERQAMVVGVAGAAAALSVVLGNPLIAAVFLLEAVGLAGPQLTAVVLPCLASAGIGAIVFTGLGTWTGLTVEKLALTLPAGTARLDLPDLLWTVGIAAVIAVGVNAIHRIGRRVAPIVDRRGLPLTVLAAAAVAVCIAAYALVTGRSPAEAALSGQDTLATLAADPHAWPVGALVALLLLKGVGYGISLGALRGGPIFPAVFLGAAAGVLCAPLPGFGVTPAIAAGIAAATAAALPFPVSAAVLGLLLLGPAGANMTPVVLTAAVTGFVVHQLCERYRAARPPQLS